jgi:hypothetical protein
MANKALVTRRSGTDPVDTKDLEAVGTPIELETPRGILVELKDEVQAEKLEALGYRVKFLPDTDILRVGEYIIRVKDGQAETQPGVPPELEVPPPLVDSWQHHLVQLKLPPSEEEIATIESFGLEVVEPISAYGLFVVGEPSRVKSLDDSHLSFVSWVGPFKPAYKIESRLLRMQGLIRYLSIGIYPEHELLNVFQALAEKDGKIIRNSGPPPDYSSDYWRIIAGVDAEHLLQLARLPGVRWLEFASPEPGLDGEREAQILAENLNGAVPVPGYQQWLANNGLSGGSDITIAICDTGVSQNETNNTDGHLDLRGRQKKFIDYTGNGSKPDENGHGTVVASIAVGNAATLKRDGNRIPCGLGKEFLCGQGVAPAAAYVTQNPLVAQPWPPEDFGTLTARAVQEGAHIMNNSWNDGGDAGAGYTSNAQRFDQLVRDPDSTGRNLDNLIIVFSAGNKGQNGLHTMTPPHEAKNIIVVGSSLTYLPGIGDALTPDDIKGVDETSSRGPARDGRFLPNIMAPGNNVTGAIAGTTDGHVPVTGTSMAAPLVAGACAILLEWWRKKGYTPRPSPAMMKAMLINGAETLEGGPHSPRSRIAHAPNNIQGWGRVSLATIINDPPKADRGPKLFFDQKSPFTAASQTQTLRVKPALSSRPMRVTLVWTDAPGAPDSSPNLVNDLDLEVIETATNRVFKGNVFDPRTGFSATGGLADSLNNIECVYIYDPNGEYQVVVIAATLKGNARPPFDNTPWQDYALVIDNAEILR